MASNPGNTKKHTTEDSLLDCPFLNCEKKISMNSRFKHLTEDHELYSYETTVFRLNLAEADLLPLIESGGSERFVSTVMSCYQKEFAVVVNIEKGKLLVWCELASPLKEMKNMYAAQFELASDTRCIQSQLPVHDPTDSSAAKRSMSLSQEDVEDFLVKCEGKAKRRLPLDIWISYNYSQ